MMITWLVFIRSCFQKKSKSIYLSQPNTHKYKTIMTTYKKLLYDVTGSKYPRSWCSACTGYPCIENK